MFAVPVIYYDNIWMFVEVIFHRCLRIVGDKTFVSNLVCSPPEPITLSILLGKHQQDLKNKRNLLTYEFSTCNKIITLFYLMYTAQENILDELEYFWEIGLKA